MSARPRQGRGRTGSAGRQGSWSGGGEFGSGNGGDLRTIGVAAEPVGGAAGKGEVCRGAGGWGEHVQLLRARASAAGGRAGAGGEGDGGEVGGVARGGRRSFR